MPRRRRRDRPDWQDTDPTERMTSAGEGEPASGRSAARPGMQITPSEVAILRASEFAEGLAAAWAEMGRPASTHLGETDLAGGGLSLFEGHERLPSSAWAHAMLTTALLAL